jgi:hypothetical protein
LSKLRSSSRTRSRSASSRDGDRRRRDEDPVFPDALLDIGNETKLLTEIKDIRDELNIIDVILESQTLILDEFESHIIDDLRGGANLGATGASSTNLAGFADTGQKRAVDLFVSDIRKRGREQRRRLDVHRKDIDRMNRQAESIYLGLTHLLDLKQKHSNALEARFARDQAVIAAKQGQTVMIFTIVTIIFLPMSFMAAFFAINIEDWGDGRLTLEYVSKYMFGIGLGISIPLIILAFTAADIANAATTVWDTMKAQVKGYQRQKQSNSQEPALRGNQANTRDIDSWDSDDMEKPHARGRNVAGGLSLPGHAYEHDHLTSSYARASYEPRSDRLSPVSMVRVPWPPKLSIGSGNALSWSRPSHESAMRPRRSDDIERGGDFGLSSRLS